MTFEQLFEKYKNLQIWNVPNLAGKHIPNWENEKWMINVMDKNFNRTSWIKFYKYGEGFGQYRFN